MQGSDLQVPEGETFSIVGGNINIAGGNVAAPSGRINLASVASPGEVKVAGGNLNVESFARLGSITFSRVTTVNTSSGGGGSMFIRGGHLTVDTSLIASSTLGTGNGGIVDIQVNGDVIINGGVISAATSGDGNAGTVLLKGTKCNSVKWRPGRQWNP